MKITGYEYEIHDKVLRYRGVLELLNRKGAEGWMLFSCSEDTTVTGQGTGTFEVKLQRTYEVDAPADYPPNRPANRPEPSPSPYQFNHGLFGEPGAPISASRRRWGRS